MHTAFWMAIIVMFKREKPSISDLNQYQKAEASIEDPTNQIEIKESAWSTQGQSATGQMHVAWVSPTISIQCHSKVRAAITDCHIYQNQVIA